MTFAKKSLWVSLLAVLLFLGVGQTVFAAGYGQGSYGSCPYGKSCGSTVVTTPSGLEVAINLANGQVIPRGGYTITITPLNGSESSFAKADIYIDSVLRGTSTPGQNGTATWFWDVAKWPGTHVRVVVFDTQGGQIDRDFTVSIASDGQGAPNAGGQNQGGSGNSEATGGGGGAHQNVVAKIVGGAQNFVKRLPANVVSTIPWLLFLLLLIEIFLLIWQTERELRELRVLQALIEREKNIAGMKIGLMQLVSHYLRTPFTVLKSGVEGIDKYGIAPEVVQRIQRAVQGLGTSIEGLIAGVEEQAAVTQQASSVISTLTRRYTRQRIVVWVPVIFIGAVVGLFVWLAYSVNRLEGGIISVLIHTSWFVLLGISIWLVSRRLYLKKRDTTNAKVVLSEAVAVQQSRDAFIQSTASMLTDYITTLEQAVKSIPATAPMAKFIIRGLDQLSAIQQRFIIATRLKGARSADLYKAVRLKQLFDQAASTTLEPAQNKQVDVKLMNDVDLVIQDENLTVAVLQSLLDNAIAYSNEGGEVAVAGHPKAQDGFPAISVIDHGRGIPKEKLDMLFQPFSKVEGAETFTHEGMGFSLYLDKLIMAYLGGDIDLESEPGKATQATIKMPVGATRKR